jgi:hypothetical protein
MFMGVQGKRSDCPYQGQSERAISGMSNLDAEVAGGQ